MSAAEQTGLATAQAIAGQPVTVRDLKAALALCAAQIECAAADARKAAEYSETLARNCATQGAQDTHTANARERRDAAGRYDRTAASARAIARARVISDDEAEAREQFGRDILGAE